MDHPLLSKMRLGAGLTAEDEVVLSAAMGRTSQHGAQRELLRSDATLGSIHVVLDGLACRYVLSAQGRRQILSLLVRGDVIDLRPSVLGPMDHSIAAFAPCTLASIPASAFEAWTATHPRIGRAFARAALVDEAVLRQWLVNLGLRSVEQRIAHLFLELLLRLHAVGLATQEGYALPITQDDLGSIVGGSLVHVCRVLTELRIDGLVEFRHREVKIVDLARLTALAEFDPGYLHLGDASAITKAAPLRTAHAA